jgi:hypothetical protein
MYSALLADETFLPRSLFQAPAEPRFPLMFPSRCQALAWMSAVFFAALCPKNSLAQVPGLYGSLEMAPRHFVICRQAGLKVAVVAVSWERFEPAPGAFDDKYIETLASEKEQLRKLGYQLQLDLGVQYPPGWLGERPAGRYTNQFGDSFVSTQPGANLPNVVFNAGIRQRLADYLGEIFEKLGADWDFVRLGCARYGELNYPQTKYKGHDNCYWAFDDLAQGRTPGLPEGIPPCPVPGWLPGTPSANHAAARKFIEWYLDALENYQNWQIATVRRWYAGDICMLYGSWSVRPGWLDNAVDGDLGGGTPCERNGEIQQGFDWARMIGGITDPRVIVYCTWIDGTIGNRDIADDNSPDPARWSPVHWQASLARANPRHLRVWGENTGQNNLAAMRLTFERIQRFNLMGVMWAFDRELFADPNPAGYATFSDYSKLIRAEDR